MKYFFLFFISISAMAGWTNWPSPRGDASTKEACESAPWNSEKLPCYEYHLHETDELVLVMNDEQECDDRGENCRSVKVPRFFKDKEKARLKKEAKDAEKAAAQAERARLKQILESVSGKDPTKEELRDALKALLKHMLGDDDPKVKANGR